jgi:hypothetical protein
MAYRTCFETTELDLLFGPEHCLFKGKPQCIAQIGSAQRPTGAASRPDTTEKGIENRAKGINTSKRISANATETGRIVTKPIVHRPLLFVREHLVGLVDLFELRLSVRRFIHIGMILAG